MVAHKAKKTPTHKAPRPVARKAAPKPQMAKKPSPPSVAGKTLAIDELRGEVESLRSALKQSLEQYSLRVGRHLAELAGALAAPAKGAKAGVPAKALRQMLVRMRASKLKPAKGRVKDLARIEKLVESLMALLPEES